MLRCRLPKLDPVQVSNLQPTLDDSEDRTCAIRVVPKYKGKFCCHHLPEYFLGLGETGRNDYRGNYLQLHLKGNAVRDRISKFQKKFDRALSEWDLGKRQHTTAVLQNVTQVEQTFSHCSHGPLLSCGILLSVLALAFSPSVFFTLSSWVNKFPQGI